MLVSARSLRAAKPVTCCTPPSYDNRPRSFRFGSLSTSCASVMRVFARRDAAARADGDIDHDVGDDAGLLRRVVQIARVLIVVNRLDEAREAFLQLHRAANLRRRQVAGRHQHPVDACRRAAPRLR